MKGLGRRDWILFLLSESSLDRIHLMKGLFLVWYKSDRLIEDYFQFEPYLYGPCSLEVYASLNELLQEGFIAQPQHHDIRYEAYSLTPRGLPIATERRKLLSGRLSKVISGVVSEIKSMGFHELLKMVYKEAPEYAVNSMFKNTFV